MVHGLSNLGKRLVLSLFLIEWMTKTGNQMIIDHTDGLQIGIYDGRTYKGKASFLQIPADPLT